MNQYWGSVMAADGVFGLLGVLVGSGISSGTNYLIARNARKRFTIERIWDVRREIYTKIIASTTANYRHAETVAYCFTDEANGENYDGSPAFNRHADKTYRLNNELNSLVENNRIILSKKVLEWHQALVSDIAGLEEQVQYESAYETANERERILTARMGEIVRITRSEVGVKD